VVEDYLTNGFLHKRLGYATLRFRFIVRDTDELRQAQILHEQYDMNAVTPDEIRQVYERDPLPNGKGALTKDEYATQALPGLPGGELPALGGPPALDDAETPVAPEETPEGAIAARVRRVRAMRQRVIAMAAAAE